MDDLDFLDEITSSPGGNNSGRNNGKKALKFEGLEGDSVDDEEENRYAFVAVFLLFRLSWLSWEMNTLSMAFLIFYESFSLHDLVVVSPNHS